MSSNYVVCSNLSFAWPDGTSVFDDLSVTVGAGRTGLVAPNGAGKSTLLKLLAGEYSPRTGSVSVDGVVGYLPQTLPLAGEPTVAEVLEIAPITRALAAIESGDASEEHFAVIGSDWDVEDSGHEALDRRGQGNAAIERPLGQLSGVEVVSTGHATQLEQLRDNLIFDEPTNNLVEDVRRR